MSQAIDTSAFVAESYQIAQRCQASGDLDEAKRRYGQILVAVPHHAESLTMLSSLSYQQGDDVQAQAYIERAIAIYRAVVTQMPKNLNVRAPLVNLLLARNRIEEAEIFARDLDLPLNPMRASPEEFVRRRRQAMERGLPPILINSLPKSASESIWNQLAEGLDLAQCHLSIGLFPDCCLIPSRVTSAAEGGLIAKEHLPATKHNLNILAEQGLTKLLFHLRDPRQATLSWAHFVQQDVSMRMMAPIWRKIVPPREILQQDLGGLLDWCIEHYLPLLVEFIGGWEKVSRNKTSPFQVLLLSFEEFRTDPGRFFERVLGFYEIDPALFADDAEAEVVHLRKGLLDEWREVFSDAQCEAAWQAIPEDLAATFGWRK